MKKLALVCIVVLLSGLSFGACPSADLTDDCEVDLEDFAVLASGWLTTYGDTDLYSMASEWLTHGVPEDPAKMAWVIINDSGAGMKDKNGNPISQGGFTGEMSKYETTNAQYCQFLNAALASGDVVVVDDNVRGAIGSNSGEDYEDETYLRTYTADPSSQISFDGSKFSVRTRDGYDMSDHPVVEVSWYGAMAFCNYYGYRLPTEWEWQAVADYDGSYTYGCGTTIDSSLANFGWSNPLGLTRRPYTTPVDHYPAFGYGINGMTGNAAEWTSSDYRGYGEPIFRTGSWWQNSDWCTVSSWSRCFPYYIQDYIGFRVCR